LEIFDLSQIFEMFKIGRASCKIMRRDTGDQNEQENFVWVKRMCCFFGGIFFVNFFVRVQNGHFRESQKYTLGPFNPF